MPNHQDLGIYAASVLFEKAEPRLRELLRQRGANSPRDVPQEVAANIFQQAIIETAGAHFPTAQLDALSHGFKSFFHPAFFPAVDRVRMQNKNITDAFAMASGIDLAVVLAGLGLPVAPFDRKTPRILAEPSNDLDEVATNFEKLKTAFVGYCPCDVPFYMLVTDCIRTLRTRFTTYPQLAELRTLIDRAGQPIEDPGTAFQHGLMLFSREPGDRISTVALNDPNPNAGSIALFAGWRTDTGPDGAPNGGYLPVPLQFVRAALNDIGVAFWIWRPVGVKSVLLN